MGKYIRVIVAIVVVLSLVVLAKDKTASAANSEAKTSLSVWAQIQPSGPLHSDDDCDKEHHKAKCKDKDKHKDKCKDKHDDCGTVQPPANDIDVCKRGNYSVGGVATLDVDKLQDRSRKNDCFHATSEDSSNVSGLPKNAGAVLSDLVNLTSVGQGSIIRVCFAVVPGKKVKIYAAVAGSWQAVGTEVKNGVACAKVSKSGSYLLVGK